MSRNTPASDAENDPDSEEELTPSAPPRSMALDLGDDGVYNVEASCSAQQETTRREDNPFSFKHFLKDSNKQYQSLGARPKLYTNRRSPSDSPKLVPSSRIINEYSSALPDFVQDHLVIEQSYLGNNTHPTYDYQLPEANSENPRSEAPFVSSRPNSESGPIPLDLPGLSLGNSFPLDLPPRLPVPCANVDTIEVGTLPDFLTDGPVGTSLERSTSPSESGGDAGGNRCSHCAEMMVELNSLRQRLNHAEDEVERSRTRTLQAENNVSRYKQELNNLKAQLRQIQAENNVLKDGAGAGSIENVPAGIQAQRMAQELRSAASAAEQSLRSMLSGVDNLRMMASTLENFNRFDDSFEKFNPFDDDHDLGPAL